MQFNLVPNGLLSWDNVTLERSLAVAMSSTWKAGPISRKKYPVITRAC
jgi:hypothetical protein